MARTIVTSEDIDDFKEDWQYTYHEERRYSPIELKGEKDPWDATKNWWKSTFDLSQLADIIVPDKPLSKKYKFVRRLGENHFGVDLYHIKSCRTVFMRLQNRTFISKTYFNSSMEDFSYTAALDVRGNVRMLYQLFPQYAPAEIHRQLFPKLHQYCLKHKFEQLPSDEQIVKLLQPYELPARK